MERPTVLVKSWHPDQGPHVTINKESFDPEKHELYELPAPPAADPAPVVQPPVPAADPLAGLPADWADKPLSELQPIVEAVSGRTADDQAQAVAMIQAAIAAKAVA